MSACKWVLHAEPGAQLEQGVPSTGPRALSKSADIEGAQALHTGVPALSTRSLPMQGSTDQAASSGNMTAQVPPGAHDAHDSSSIFKQRPADQALDPPGVGLAKQASIQAQAVQHALVKSASTSTAKSADHAGDAEHLSSRTPPAVLASSRDVAAHEHLDGVPAMTTRAVQAGVLAAAEGATPAAQSAATLSGVPIAAAAASAAPSAAARAAASTAASASGTAAATGAVPIATATHVAANASALADVQSSGSPAAPTAAGIALPVACLHIAEADSPAAPISDQGSSAMHGSADQTSALPATNQAAAPYAAPSIPLPASAPGSSSAGPQPSTQPGATALPDAALQNVSRTPVSDVSPTAKASPDPDLAGSSHAQCRQASAPGESPSSNACKSETSAIYVDLLLSLL